MKPLLCSCLSVLALPLAPGMGSIACAAAATMTAKSVQAALAAKPVGAEAEQLAGELRQFFGPENLQKGTGVKTEELTVVWALEAPSAAETPKVVSEDGRFRLLLDRLGSADLYAAARE